MARSLKRPQALALLALFALPLVTAQLTDLPNLSTVTGTTAKTSATSESAASSATTASATSATSASKADTTSATSQSSSSDASTITSATVTFSTGSSSTSNGFSLTGAPTIAGAGIPSIGVPYTAAAPFMQKSNMPEGTVFIIVGAILAFFGACVLLWRGIVAWSINRSVKRAAIASVRGDEKRGSIWRNSSYNPIKNNMYKDSTLAGSNMSLDALTSQGKPIRSFKDNDGGRASPPPNLFFSPTAAARNSVIGLSHDNNRNSQYLPAGYYAAPSAQAAGGEHHTTIGGSLAPYARHSQFNPSPPLSPNMSPSSRIGSSDDRASSLDRLQPPHSRDGAGRGNARGSYIDRNSYVDNRQSYVERSPQRSPRLSVNPLGQQASTSSLALNLPGSQMSSDISSSGIPGSRAPSAYLDDLFENHGNGPRERF